MTPKPAEVKREHLIDCIRLLMAFLVVFIHSPFGGKAGQIIFSFGKTAVPFFIVVSGYFCYSAAPEQFAARLKKQAARIFMLCAGANFLYVFLYLIGNYIGWIPVKLSRLITEKSLIELFLYNQSPVADHLWFLGSLLYALILMLIFVKLKIDRFVMFVLPLLLCGYLFLSYTGSAQDAIKYRNALLVTLPYFTIGCLIRRYKDVILTHVKPVIYNSITVIFAAMVVVEYFIRKNTNVPYLSAEVLVYLIVIICLRYSGVGKDTVIEWLGSRCTLFVYIVHMAILWVFWYKFTGFFKYPALMTVLAFAIPLAVSAVIEGIKARKKRLRMMAGDGRAT